MVAEKKSDLEHYDTKVEIFYPEKIPSDLRSLLDEEVDDYVEKYTEDLLASDPVPVMAVEKGGEVQTLLGNEIKRKNIEEILD